MTYRVMIVSWGGTEKTYLNGLTYQEARQFCEHHDWQLDLGYIWDLDIKEDHGGEPSPLPF